MLKVTRRILAYSKPYSVYLAIAILSALIGTSISIYIPVFIGDAVDFIAGKNNVDFSGLSGIIAKLIIAISVSLVFQWITGVSSSHLAYKTIRDLRCDIFKKYNSLPIKAIDASSKGDLISRSINDAEILSEGLYQVFTQLFTGTVTILGTLILMVMLNAKIALIVVIMTPLSLFAAAKITKMSHSAFKEQSILRGETNGIAEELIGGQKIVKAFSYEKMAEKRFNEINDQLGEVSVKSTFYSSLTNPTTRFINGLIYVAVGLSGAFSIFSGQMSIGNLASFLSYSNQYTKPFNEISGVVAELQNAIASAERIFDILDAQSEPDDSHLPSLDGCNGDITFEDVCFSYSSDTSLIEDFSLSVKSGQKIAIVGPTGCGKTTVINLLLRFYDIRSGKIFISGTDISSITRNSLRLQFGMVLQDTWLFSGTIAENIAYGNPDASIEEITDAAKAVYAHGFIKRLPDGYNTVIDENGAALSQGQMQLISIARIMLMNPPMLILDEATSSIDIRTEQKIQMAFDRVMQGKTSFIIAHRLSTIRNCDLILVMNKGKIVEKGNYEELMRNNGFYARLESGKKDLS